MEANADKHFYAGYGQLGTGGYAFSKTRLVIVCLALLNIVLLIVAVVIGVKCAKVKDGSSQAAHSAATKLLTELNDLRGNHSDIMMAAEDARLELEKAIKGHKEMKLTIEELRVKNDAYREQFQILQVEKISLQANVTALEGTCGKCPPKWTLYNSSCYYFSCLDTTDKKNWHQSREYCTSRGADLVIIEDLREQEFVSDSIKSAFKKDNSWTKGSWIGITDLAKEGTWVWVNNVTEVAVKYWADGEPNNHGALGEDCVILVYQPSSPWQTWFDGKCTKHQLSWICEMPVK